MKKTISITISGLIFHIEEDGYERLRAYLDSIQRHFSKMPGSEDIIADIEARIAEIFNGRLSEAQQVITVEDVQKLIETMGEVKDFGDFEEPEPAAREVSSSPGHNRQEKTRPRSLSRDQKRKVLGGVCAGLGHYFGIDMVWPRLLFLLLVVFSSGIFIIVYIILWAVLPGDYDLEDRTAGQRVFRDPDQRVIAGVCSGLASFLRTDVSVIRILFVVLLLLGGTGLLLYIGLWIAMPEAHTLTEKIQMKGGEVTLSAIETSVKKKDEPVGPPQESALSQALLFPFRLIGTIFSALGRALGPLFTALGEVLRVTAGGILFLIGLSFVVAFAWIFGFFGGWFELPELVSWGGASLRELGLPWQPMSEAIPGWVVAAAFAASAIPPFFLLLLGASLLARKIIFSASTGWTLLVIFLVSVVFLSINIPALVLSFEKRAEVQIEETFTISDTPVLALREVGLDDYDVTRFDLVPTAEDQVRVVQVRTARGATRAKAIEHARAVHFGIEQKESTLTFDSNLTFPEGVPFRFQELRVAIYLPVNKPFEIQPGFWRLLSTRHRFFTEDEPHRYRISEEGELTCLDCD